MRFSLAFSLFCLASPAAASCDAFREYLTTYNYLLDKKTIAFTKDQASRTAMQVARGCDGAAGRFIRVFDLLVNARITLDQASQMAQDVATSGDESTANFVEVFKAAYLEKSLDLPLGTALDLARALSGKGRWVRHDYTKLVEFCLGRKGLSLPKPECATLARDVALLGEENPDKSVADAFVELIEFLRSDADGPCLTSFEALQLTRELMALSVEAGRNFIPGYKFARDKNQLGLDRAKAVAFARGLAALTKEPSETK